VQWRRVRFVSIPFLFRLRLWTRGRFWGCWGWSWTDGDFVVVAAGGVVVVVVATMVGGGVSGRTMMTWLKLWLRRR